MQAQQCYCVNAPNVISEVIDGEAIILNFDSGCYYSLNETGRVAWVGLQQGMSFESLAASIRERFDTGQARVSDDLTALLESFLAEHLVSPVQQETSSTPQDFQGDVQPYTKPVLQKFSDLQDLLLLDPIHDVDDSGWPHQTT